MIMKKWMILFCACLLAGVSNAQTVKAPVMRWADENVLAVGEKYFDAGTGKEFIYTEKITRVTYPKKVLSEINDLYLYNDDGTKTRLTANEDKELNATMSPDGNFVAFTRNKDLYTIDLSTKKENRLTMDGGGEILNGYASWVYMEEILGRASNYRAFWWSPDSKHIAFFRSDESNVPEFITTDADSTAEFIEKIRYPKTGQPNPEIKIGIVSPQGGEITWADFNERDDQYFGMPYWKPDSKTLLVQWMNRLQNELKIYAVDINTGTRNIFYEESQKTWVSLDDQNRLSFLKNGKNIIVESDASGWNHLYNYDINGKLLNPITKGKFTVTKLEHVDEANGWVYFTGRGLDNTARRDIYRASMNGKKLERLSKPGFDNILMSISPDKKSILYRADNTTTPTTYFVVSTDGKKSFKVFDTKDNSFDFAKLPKTELIRVKSDDGKFDLPMKVTWPKDMQPGKKYPVLISIYGGPDAGRVWDNWSTPSKLSLSYAKEGLIQVAMDHRASGHFGKEGINYMYHDFGNWELRDYSTMVRWLIANGQADPEKICITGFSYGGYITSLALTKFSDVFTHGIAGGSVTDWTMYDSHYTERYMGTPANNPDGYKTSSVLNYVKDYKGKLLLVHGVIDENVHLTNTLALAASLQDNLKDFEMMLYSGGRHGWRNLAGRWAHYEMLQKSFIYRHLLQKPLPAE